MVEGVRRVRPRGGVGRGGWGRTRSAVGHGTRREQGAALIIEHRGRRPRGVLKPYDPQRRAGPSRRASPSCPATPPSKVVGHTPPVLLPSARGARAHPPSERGDGGGGTRAGSRSSRGPHTPEVWWAPHGPPRPHRQRRLAAPAARYVGASATWRPGPPPAHTWPRPALSPLRALSVLVNPRSPDPRPSRPPVTVSRVWLRRRRGARAVGGAGKIIQHRGPGARCRCGGTRAGRPTPAPRRAHARAIGPPISMKRASGGGLRRPTIQ